MPSKTPNYYSRARRGGIGLEEGLTPFLNTPLSFTLQMGESVIKRIKRGEALFKNPVPSPL